MKVTINEKEFTEKFNQVLENNPTIVKILSKVNNLGITTQLVLDQIKAELKESIFADAQSEEPDPTVEKVETKETEEDQDTDTGSDIDDLDELDEEV